VARFLPKLPGWRLSYHIVDGLLLVLVLQTLIETNILIILLISIHLALAKSVTKPINYTAC